MNLTRRELMAAASVASISKALAASLITIPGSPKTIGPGIKQPGPGGGPTTPPAPLPPAVNTSVWSAADATANGMTLSNGGLTVAATLASWKSVRGTNSQTTGKFYAEFLVVTAGNSNNGFGIASASFNSASYLGSSNYSYGGFSDGSTTGGSSGFTALVFPGVLTNSLNDVFQIAVDLTAGKIWVAKNNGWSTDPASGNGSWATFVAPALGQAFFPAMSLTVSGGVWTLQAIAASQKYAPPSGFTAWDGP